VPRRIASPSWSLEPPSVDEPLDLFGQAARSTRQTSEIMAIDYDWLFSATVQQKTAGMRNRE